MKSILCSLFVCGVSIAIAAQADPSKSRKINHAKSQCHVDVAGGEYPGFKVFKKGRKEPIFAPKSDGISDAKFSNSGTYIAFGSSEIDFVDVGSEQFGVAVLNCDTGKSKGFLAGKIVNGRELKWSANDMSLSFNIYDPNSEKNTPSKLDFSKENSLP